jgi:hypothetical protein
MAALEVVDLPVAVRNRLAAQLRIPLTRRLEYPHVSRIDEQEFHWLVGILEGEGTFLRGAPSKPGTPVLRVSMTDRDVVERVATLFGRAVVRLRRRKPHHKLPYATTIKGAPAVQVMSAVRPFLGKTRKLQIDRAISSLQTRKGPRHRRRAAGSDSPSALMPLWDPSGTLTAHGASEGACDRAWIAGLLEGEGSFIASRATGCSYPVIKVEMCEREVVERAARLLDTRVWLVAPGTEGWRPTYVARIAGHRAAEWMRALRPYMGLRRTAAIDAALSAYHPVRLIAPPLVCVVEGCERPHRARGLCNAHYMIWSRDLIKGRTPRVTPLR